MNDPYDPLFLIMSLASVGFLVLSAVIIGRKPKMEKRKDPLFAVWVFLVAVLLLGGFLVSQIGKPGRSARRAICLNNLKGIGLALRMYATDYNGQFPEQGLWQLYRGDYLHGSIGRCPGDSGSLKKPRAQSAEEFQTGNFSDYLYFPGRALEENVEFRTWIVLDKAGNHDNFRYALGQDGSVQETRSQGWWSTNQPDLSKAVGR